MEISSRERGPGPGFQIVTGGHSKHGQTFFFHVCVFTKLCKALYTLNFTKIAERATHGDNRSFNGFAEMREGETEGR